MLFVVQLENTINRNIDNNTTCLCFRKGEMVKLLSLISLITENAAKTVQIFVKNVSSTSTHINTNSLHLQKICSIILPSDPGALGKQLHV